MRSERFYHSASSAAENHVESGRFPGASSSAVAILEKAYPQALESSAYALRKRLVCPRWWLSGVMSQWAIKDADFLQGQLGLRDGDLLLSGPALTAKTFPLVVSLWTELLAQFSHESAHTGSVEINLARILKGTAQEVHDQREFLISYLSSALRVQRVRTVQKGSSSRRTKSTSSAATLQQEAVALVQLVENVVLMDSLNHKLSVTFSRDPRKLFSSDVSDFLPSSLLGEMKEKASLRRFGAAMVTLQPDVLQAMSRSLSPKKLLSYLSLELMKSDATKSGGDGQGSEESVWRGHSLGAKELAQLHKDQLTQARSFYDHGLLSWENEAPRQRVRSLAHRDSASQTQSGIVRCWRLSQHALDATQFEQALSSFVRSEEFASGPLIEAPAVVEPKKIPSAPDVYLEKSSVSVVGMHQTARKTTSPTVDLAASLLKSERTASETAIKPAGSEKAHGVCSEEPAYTRSVAQKPVGKSVAIETTSRDSWSDDEFLMCVAEFYESLTPLQQQAFERERRRMSPEQFRSYVTPALMRHKVKND